MLNKYVCESCCGGIGVYRLLVPQYSGKCSVCDKQGVVYNYELARKYRRGQYAK